jgi:tRNA-2-methylthio-N6-dimethylallyladenosine synthase
LPEALKDERLQLLQHEIDRELDAFNARAFGTTMDVLFEKPGKRPGQIVGKSPYLQAVHIMGPTSLIGEIHPVTIDKIGSFTLSGVLARTPRPHAQGMPAVAGA